MACSIETLLDLKELSIEELSGRLAASEGRGEPEPESGGRLFLTEEEWAVRHRQNLSLNAPSGGNTSKPTYKGKQ
jgi:hypothetical protein